MYSTRVHSKVKINEEANQYKNYLDFSVSEKCLKLLRFL
jgi:hypothetical protein